MTQLNSDYFEDIQRIALRNIEYQTYTMINGKMTQPPKLYWEGQFYMAKNLQDSDLSKVNFEGLITRDSEHLKGRDYWWYLGRIDLARDIINLLNNQTELEVK